MVAGKPVMGTDPVRTKLNPLDKSILHPQRSHLPVTSFTLSFRMAISILRTCPILIECAQPASHMPTSRPGMCSLVLVSARKSFLPCLQLWTNCSAESRYYAGAYIGHYTIRVASEPHYDTPKTGLESWPRVANRYSHSI